MKITNVEAIYVRQPKVKAQCDSGQDVLIVRVETDEGITGIGEVDSAPMSVKHVKSQVSESILTRSRSLVFELPERSAKELWNEW